MRPKQLAKQPGLKTSTPLGPTREELIASINAIAAEYLGFQTEEWGLKSKTRKQLQNKLQWYERMIKLKREAEAMRVESLLGTLGERTELFHSLLMQASDIWLAGARNYEDPPARTV